MNNKYILLILSSCWPIYASKLPNKQVSASESIHSRKVSRLTVPSNPTPSCGMPYQFIVEEEISQTLNHKAWVNEIRIPLAIPTQVEEKQGKEHLASTQKLKIQRAQSEIIGHSDAAELQLQEPNTTRKHVTSIPNKLYPSPIQMPNSASAQIGVSQGSEILAKSGAENNSLSLSSGGIQQRHSPDYNALAAHLQKDTHPAYFPKAFNQSQANKLQYASIIMHILEEKDVLKKKYVTLLLDPQKNPELIQLALTIEKTIPATIHALFTLEYNRRYKVASDKNAPLIDEIWQEIESDYAHQKNHARSCCQIQ